MVRNTGGASDIVEKDKVAAAELHAAFQTAETGRPTWAEINLDTLVRNFKLTRDLVGPGVAMMMAVKADAYGHGAVECGRALEGAGADWFAVAHPEEGASLRAGGISKPILCLGGFWDGQEGPAIAQRLTPVVFRFDQLARLDQAANSAGHVVTYHLKIDTGLGRLGLPYDQIETFLDCATRLGHVKLDGLMTHLAAADDPEKEDYTLRQMKLFEEAIQMVRASGHDPAWIHECNGAAARAYPAARHNMVRLGGAMYGIWRDTTNQLLPAIDLQPVMSLHTRVVLIRQVPAGTAIGYGCAFITGRQSLIATLPVGYADGMRRPLSNQGHVIVRGQRAPIVGRISMDLMMIDITDVAGASLGDEVILIGKQGTQSVTVEEMASRIGTLSYEITCGIASRVPRRYISSV
jgi:alanine racemase